MTALSQKETEISVMVGIISIMTDTKWQLEVNHDRSLDTSRYGVNTFDAVNHYPNLSMFRSMWYRELKSAMGITDLPGSLLQRPKGVHVCEG